MLINNLACALKVATPTLLTTRHPRTTLCCIFSYTRVVVLKL